MLLSLWVCCICIYSSCTANTFHENYYRQDERGVYQDLWSPQTQYQSVEHYLLQLMANPATYGTHTEIMKANQLSNSQVRSTFAGRPCPLPPGLNASDLLYSSEHFSTLRYSYTNSSSSAVSHFTLHTVFLYYTVYQQLPRSQIL